MGCSVQCITKPEVGNTIFRNILYDLTESMKSKMAASKTDSTKSQFVDN